MKAFLSSVITGFGEFRDAGAKGIAAIGYQAIRAEDFGARPDSPQQACLGAIRDSDVVVLLLGARYGDRQDSGLSATHEEFLEARDNKPLLVFCQDGVDPDEDQRAFINEVQQWVGGRFTATFTTVDALSAAVTRGLHDLAMSQASGAVDATELVARAASLIPGTRSSTRDALIVAIASGPRQAVLRPAQIEDLELTDWLETSLLTGSYALFDRGVGTATAISGDTIETIQADRRRWVRLNEGGDITVGQPARTDGDRTSGLPAIIEEDVTARIRGALTVAGHVLDHVDSTNRITRVAITCTLQGAGYTGWRTAAEHAASPNAMAISGNGRSDIAVTLTPPDRPRASLLHDTDRLTEDLVVRLRREHRR